MKNTRIPQTLLVAAGSLLAFTSLSSAADSAKVIFSPHIEGKDPSGFGVFVRDALESTLTEQPQIELIDRKQLSAALAETATNEIQSQSTNSQLKVTGANFAVYPKITSFNKNTIFTFKVVDLSTTTYRSAMVKATEESDPLTVVDQSTQKILKAIEALSKKQLSNKDAATAEKWSLAKDQPRFKVALRIPESSARSVLPDPAGEKELSSVLLDNAFTITQLSRPSQATTAAKALHLEGKEHDALMAECREKGVEVIIIGLASSDLATRIGTYNVGSARVELAAVRVSDSKVLASTKGYGKATDMSVMLAEKKAIENAVSKLAPKFIESMVSQ